MSDANQRKFSIRQVSKLMWNARVNNVGASNSKLYVLLGFKNPGKQQLY